ncbi:MAG: hypothetical protein R6V02_09905 [Candidatus Aminicenantes bacterium]
MKNKFFIEGHKSKSNYDQEDTLVLNDKQFYSSEEEATQKAKESMTSNPDLGLVVIYKQGQEKDDREGIKFLYRTKENELEEVRSWWNKPLDSCKSCE